MFLYRCYLLDDFDRIRNFVEIRAWSDTDAAAEARIHMGSEAKLLNCGVGKISYAGNRLLRESFAGPRIGPHILENGTTRN